MYFQFKNKTKVRFQEKVGRTGLIYKERLVVLTVHKLFEHEFCKNCLKSYDKMDLSIRIKIIYKLKHHYAILLKFGHNFFTSLTKFVLEAKASICSEIKENLPLHCRKLSAFAVVVMI